MHRFEINGVLCGYAHMKTSKIMAGGKEQMLLEHEVFAMVSALGSPFNSKIELTYRLDPGMGAFTYHSSHISQGPTELSSEWWVEGDSARFTSSLQKEEERVALDPGVVLENTLFYPHLKRDFVAGGITEKTYRVLEVREAAIQDVKYTKAGVEKLELAGKTYEAVILDRLAVPTGLKTRSWLRMVSYSLLEDVIDY